MNTYFMDICKHNSEQLNTGPAFSFLSQLYRVLFIFIHDPVTLHYPTSVIILYMFVPGKCLVLKGVV